MPPKRKATPTKLELPVTVVQGDEEEEIITSWPAFRAYYAEVYGKAPTEVVSAAWTAYKEAHGIESKVSPRKRGGRKVSPPKETPAKVKSKTPPVPKAKSPLKKKPLPVPPNQYVAQLIVVSKNMVTKDLIDGYKSVKDAIDSKHRKDLDKELTNYIKNIKDLLGNENIRYRVRNEGVEDPQFSLTKPNKDITDYQLEESFSNILRTAGTHIFVGNFKIDYYLIVQRSRRSKEKATNILYLEGKEEPRKSPPKTTHKPIPKPPGKKSPEFTKVSATKATQQIRKSNSNIQKVQVYFTVYKDQERLTKPSNAEVAAIEARLSGIADVVANREAANVPVLDYSEREQEVSVLRESAKVVFTQDRIYSIDEAVDLIDNFINDVVSEGPIKVGKDRLELFLDAVSTKEFNTFKIDIQGPRSPYGKKKSPPREPERAAPRGNSKQKTPIVPIDRKAEITTFTTVSGVFGIGEKDRGGNLVPITYPLKTNERATILEALKEISTKKDIGTISAYSHTFKGNTVEIYTTARSKSNRTFTIKYLEDLIVGVPIDTGGGRILYLY